MMWTLPCRDPSITFAQCRACKHLARTTVAKCFYSPIKPLSMGFFMGRGKRQPRVQTAEP